MPPKKKTRAVAARGIAVLRDGAGPLAAGRPGGGDTGLPPLPGTFHGAVERLVELVRAAVDDSVTMFKLEMANVPDTQSAADVVDGISAKAQQGLCVVVPLCEVRPSDLPGNGCSVLFDQRQYAEALLHAARAHFAFIEFDRRLIYTSAEGVRDPTAASHLLYVFSYVNTATGRTGSTAVRTTARIPDVREVIHRRRTVAVVPRPDDDDDMGETSIGDELERYRDKLDRVERSLLEESQSMADEDMRLPETTLDSSLEDVPAPALGTALHAVLPRVRAAAAADKRSTTIKQKPPRGIVSHPGMVTAAAARAAPAIISHPVTVTAAAARATPAVGRRGIISHPATVTAAAPRAAPAAARAAPAVGRRVKRRRSLSPTLATSDASDSAPVPAEPAPAEGPLTPSRQTAAHLPAAEADQLVAFFQKLNGAQTEQSRVSLTCRYAKMRYGHDVPSGVVYRLVEKAGKAAAADPEPLTEEGRRQTALAVFAELSTSHSEQSRVAYTLQYMRVQHSVRLDANTLFGWLGQGAKKPSAKRAKKR